MKEIYYAIMQMFNSVLWCAFMIKSHDQLDDAYFNWVVWSYFAFSLCLNSYFQLLTLIDSLIIGDGANFYFKYWAMLSKLLNFYLPKIIKKQYVFSWFQGDRS